uniref:receptor protein-tyrosine kinase n=1 Tax=Panagrolaimus davidi TaxID=227884 RepID=A0A914QZH5_9BILA
MLTKPPVSRQITDAYNNIFIAETKIIVNFEKILGKGSTATVYAAVFEESKSVTKQIAIKIPIQTRMDYFEEFCHELKITTILKNHSTICAATSWTLYRELPCLIFEKMDTDLLSFVKRYNEPQNVEEFPPTKLFLQFLWQISDALNFIASKKLVHRDVAARNILIAYPNIAKISDFGLCSEFDESSSMYLSSLYKKLPIKWLPIESLSERIFTEKSDVWSFGILMFEIWTKGELPYKNLNYNEQLEFLKSGQRLSVPNEMRDDIAAIMISCWNEKQNLRPTFKEIKQSIENILEKETVNYGYLFYKSEE